VMQTVDHFEISCLGAIQSRSRPHAISGLFQPWKGSYVQEILKWLMVCSMFSRSRWSIVRSASLAKGGTLKKRPSPHLHKFWLGVIQWVHELYKLPSYINYFPLFYFHMKYELYGHVHTVIKFLAAFGKSYNMKWKSWDTAQSVQWLGYGIDNQSSIPSWGKTFVFATTPRLVLGPTQPATQWVPGGSFPRSKVARAISWSLTSI
jgi:hypothetical protein